MGASASQIEDLNRSLLDCKACTARHEALRPVPGEGSAIAKVMVIGRNPGSVEDEQGRPFVGPSGRLLNAFLQNIGLERKSVFITNLIQCHTLGDREPNETEIQTCFQLWLGKYLNLIGPQLVLTMGAQPARYVLGLSRITAIHGTLYRHMSGFDCIPCIHPGAILYAGGAQYKEMLAEDEKAVKRYLGQYGLGS